MTGFETLLYQKEGSIARITLNRPQVLNAYNLAMRDDLYQVLQATRDDPSVQGAILCGAGDRAFCAGADLTEFGTAPSQAVARQVRWERDVWGLLLGLEKPTVAALHGYVLGSGVEMALLCDFRIAAEDAVFSLPETTLGMIPAAGGTQTLPRTIGAGRALELLLTGRRLDAADAYGMGLVNMVVPRQRLMEQARELLEGVLASDPAALRSAKEAVLQGMDLPLLEGLDLEARLVLALLRSGRKVVPAGPPAPVT